METDRLGSESCIVCGRWIMAAVLIALASLFFVLTAGLNTVECRIGNTLHEHGALGSSPPPPVLLAFGGEGGSSRRGHGGGGHGPNWQGVVGGILSTVPLVIPHRPPLPPGSSTHIGPGGSGTGSGSSGPGEDWNPKDRWDDIGFDGRRKSPSKAGAPSRQQEPARASAPIEKATPAAPVDDSHPENNGSIDARTFLMQVIPVMDEGMPEFVWRDHKTALKHYQSALADALKLPYQIGQIKAYLNLGNVHFLIGNFQEAVRNFEHGLALQPTAEGHTHNAAFLGNIGCAKWASGDYEGAAGYFGEALATYESIGDVTGQANTLINVGVLHMSRGDPAAAIENFTKAGPAAPMNFRGIIQAKRHIARIYRVQGRFDLSEASYWEALQISEKIKDYKLQAAVLTDLGSLYAQWGRVRGQPDKYWAAVENLALAHEISERNGLPDLYVKKSIGDLYLEMGDDLRAESYLIPAGFNSSLGRLALFRDDYEKAKAHFDRLLQSARTTKRTEDLLAASVGLGRIYEVYGDFATAEKHYSEGMDAAEEMREGMLLSERGNFFAVPINGFLPSEPAKGVTRVRIKNGEKQGKTDQTIYPGEVTKARRFTDHIALKADLSHLNVSKELRSTENRLLAKRASLLKARSLITRGRDPNLYDEKTKGINEVETRIKELVATLWQRYPEYAAARHPKPVELNQAALDPDEYVIVFDVLGEAVSAKLVRGSRVEKIAFVPLAGWNLYERIAGLRKPLDDHQQVDPSKLQVYDVESAKMLYDRLLSDALKEVPSGTSITIIPDEILGKVPFEALVVRGEASWKKEGMYPYPEGITYVGDLYPINYHQSVTGLTLSRTLRRSSSLQDRLLVMADPTFDASDPRVKEPRERRREGDDGRAAMPGEAGPGHEQARVATRSEADESAVLQGSSGDGTMAPVPGQVRRKVVSGRDEQASVGSTTPAISRQSRVDEVPHPEPAGGSAEYSFTWPRLELTGRLGRAIEQLYPNQTDLRLGREADKSVLLNSPLRRYSSIVFGTHGYFGQDIPGIMEPVLVLNMVPGGETGYLRMSEVMGLDLNADFVALTACKTGLGEYLVGEGILSMGRAFQYAGAKSVLMSLWTVPEEASVVLVESFMKNLKEGRSKADALAIARTEVRNLKKHYSHPFYWASFVLVGDAGQARSGSTVGRIAKGAPGRDSQSKQHAFQVLEQAKELGLKARSGRDYEKAREQMEQALSSFERENSRKGIGYALVALADLHSNMGRYERASDYLTRYVQETRHAGNLRSEAHASGKLGEVFKITGQYDRAVEQLTKSLNLYEMLGDVGGETVVLNRLGETYGLWGRPSDAVEYLDKALSLTRNHGDRTGEAEALRNLAWVHARQNQYLEALDLYQESLTVYRQTGGEEDLSRLDGEVEALRGLADVFRSQARYDLAIEHFNKALDLVTNAKVPVEKSTKAGHLLNAYTGLGKTYEDMGDLKKAKQYYTKGLKEAESVSRYAKGITQGSQMDGKLGGLDASEAIKGLDRIKAKTEKSKAKTAAAPGR